mgnify:CR=1 FL=1
MEHCIPSCQYMEEYLHNKQKIIFGIKNKNLPVVITELNIIKKHKKVLATFGKNLTMVDSVQVKL